MTHKTRDDVEQQWFDDVYTGSGDSMRQLTLGAVLMGSVLGGFMSLSNLYVGLKTGWGLAVAVTFCILSFAHSILAISNILHHLNVNKIFWPIPKLNDFYIVVAWF